VPSRRERALAAGYAVVDQTSVLATHLAEVIKQHAHELLTRQETKRLLDSLSERQPKLVEELVPKLLSLGEIQKVLQQLLREQVSIRDMTSILETLQDTVAGTKNPVLWVEAVRQTLGRALVPSLLGDDKKLTVVQVDVSVEDQINQAFEPQSAATRSGGLEPTLLRRVVESLRSFVGEQISVSSPVLLCNSPARFHLRRLLEPFLPRLVVLSPAEIPTTVTVQSVGVLR
jgi:flagellar biosynthesis protein FlhA